MKIYVMKRETVQKVFFRCTLVLVLLFAIGLISTATLGAFSLPIRNMVVVIDPGHGGVDPGALGKSGVTEDDINLAIALKLRRLIEQGGGTAIMLREEDTGLYTEKSPTIRAKKNEDLRNRHNTIGSSGAEILVSIHLNSFPQSQYYGAQTFYQKGDDKGRVLAECVQGELRNTLDKENDRTIKATNDIYILRNNPMPGILVECGFLSNANEERLLREEQYQEKVAWGKLHLWEYSRLIGYLCI